MHRSSLFRLCSPIVAMTVWTFYLCVLGLSLGATSAAARDSVVVDGERLTIHIDSMPLSTALRQVAHALDAELAIRGELGGVDGMALVDLPIDEALRRLVDPHGLVLHLMPGRPGVERRIVKIQVYERTPTASRRPPAEPRPEVEAVSLGTLPATEQDDVRRIRELLDAGGDAAEFELSGIATGGGSPTARRLAVTALTRLGTDEAVASLFMALEDPEPSVRLQAARGLASLRGAGAAEPLRAMLAVEPDQTVRRVLGRLIERR